MRLELVETQRYAVLSQRATRQRWFGRSVAAFTVNSPRVDYGDAALRALMEPHLRKMRAARPTTDSSMTARILRYDADRYKLAEALRNALSVGSLEACACADAHKKRALLAPLLDVTTRRPFQRAYDAWVCGCIIPALAGDATRVRYQRFPCVRAQCPGDMTLGPHARERDLKRLSRERKQEAQVPTVNGWSDPGKMISSTEHNPMTNLTLTKTHSLPWPPLPGFTPSPRGRYGKP